MKQIDEQEAKTIQSVPETEYIAGYSAKLMVAVMDGIFRINQVRRQMILRAIPVVIPNRLDQAERKTASSPIKLADHVAKPLGQDELLTRICKRFF